MKLSRLVPLLAAALTAGVLLGQPQVLRAAGTPGVPHYSRTDLNIRSLRLPVGGLFLANTVVTPTATELNTIHGLTSSTAQLNKLAAVTGYPMEAAEATFTETAGAGTYTGTVTVPAGGTISNIVVTNVVQWNTMTSATMKVGDAGTSDGWFTGVNLKATDLLTGTSISFDNAGGKAGTYIAGSEVANRYSATSHAVIGVITTVGTTGSAGRTRMLVTYSVPTATAATKA